MWNKDPEESPLQNSGGRICTMPIVKSERGYHDAWHCDSKNNKCVSESVVIFKQR